MGESVCRVVCFSVCRGLGKKHTFAGGFWKNSTSETASNQGVTSHKLAAGLKKHTNISRKRFGSSGSGTSLLVFPP